MGFLTKEKCDFLQCYINQPEDFYASQMITRGLRHLWFKKRQTTVGEFVEKYYEEGAVLDLGCGNCMWNDKFIPTVGVDICENMLRYNVKVNPNFFPLRANFFNPLPFKSKSFSIVVVTEVLEHFQNYPFLLSEIKRVLKNNGIVIGSVPYSKFPGLWGVLFPIWCLYKGIRNRDKYYLNNCGHKVSFSVSKLKEALKDFYIEEIKIIGLLTIFFVARKI